MHYFIVGETDPYEEARLTSIIQKLDLIRHVTLTGGIDDVGLIDYYMLADVFVMPSSKEGFGMVFIEAAACGCQVIAGNSDGSREAVLNGRLGKIVDSADSEMLKLAIVEKLTIKPSDACKRHQQQLSLKHFGYRQYVEKIRADLIDQCNSI
jgi:glycosyltransferase involved in cell wall biosynthesis